MDLDEIEDICYWNLSFGIPIEETLKDLGCSELLFLFTEEITISITYKRFYIMIILATIKNSRL